ncbi:MAG: 3-deoxy-D-manno-octulosonic acid transferase [Mariprofundus sp.]|nr:3-deoxy-D-manno-octulosonic acid transferase [Mariprofundus sp.]
MNSTTQHIKGHDQTLTRIIHKQAGLAQNTASCSNTAMRKSGFAISKKWRQHLTIDLPQARPGCIWVHACSVGEVGSVTPLIRALLEQGYSVHLSVVTATGFAHAYQLLGNSISLSFLPWDFPTAMMRLVRSLKPSLLLLAETEFWPGMLSACKKHDIPIVGINTRISDHSFPRYQASRWLWKRWLAPVSLFLPQSQTDAERLIAMGVASDKIEVAGNLKYAIKAPAVNSKNLRDKLDISGSRPILLVASTHEGEDSRLLDMWPVWHAVCPELLTIIVPRHPERFDQVANLILERGYSLSRWSELNDHDTRRHNTDFVLLDSMGLLTGLYTVADIVIVAGSLENVGGHNPLEAAICGRGVVTGPYVQNFRDIMTEMQQSEAAIISRNNSELEAAITRLLKHPDELRHLNASAALFIQDRAQILGRILTAIQPWTSDSRNHRAQPA